MRLNDDAPAFPSRGGALGGRTRVTLNEQHGQGDKKLEDGTVMEKSEPNVEPLDDKQFSGQLRQMGGHTGNFWLRNYNNLTEADREEMKVDEIFALYLYRLSNRTNEQYWKKSALPFVILFRECLNEYGW